MKAQRKNRPLIFTALLALMIVTSVRTMAHSVTSGDIAVGHIWAYPADVQTAKSNAVLMQSMPGGPAIDVFGPLFNGGNTAEAVTGVTSPAFKAANIINWIRGSQYTQELPLALPPGKPVALGPQTQFLRLYGLDKAYQAGDRFPITFHFQHTPDATIDVIVQAK